MELKAFMPGMILDELADALGVEVKDLFSTEDAV